MLKEALYIISKFKRVLSFCTLSVLLFNPTCIQAQYFNVNGDATDNGGGCYELTPAAQFKTGSIWSLNKVSLTNSFEITGKLNFGSISNGADGIAFALQPVQNTATGVGAGLGVGFINPSLVVEFDTFRNGYDPFYDHVAIIRDGVADHGAGSTLSAPVQIKAGSFNVKNNSWYDYKISWDAPTQTLSVEIDCDLRISYTGDAINDIFGGDPNVFWGFSSACGGKFNSHKVCVDASTLFKIEDTKICEGDTATINLPSVGTNYSLNSFRPTTGIIDASAPNPTFSQTITTQYIITYEGSCNTQVEDTFTVEIDAAPVVDLGKDTTACGPINITLDAKNAGSTYLWSTGATSQSISSTTTGDYEVIVTNATGCKGYDTLNIGQSTSLNVSLGKDTAFCGVFNLTLDAQNNGSTYLWGDGSTQQTLNTTVAGLYFVTVTSVGGCVGIDSINVTSSNQLIVELGTDTSLCQGNNIILDADNPGTNYLWSTGATTQTLTVLTAGTYFVEASTANGCIGRDTITVSFTSTPSINLGNDIVFCGDTTFALNGGNTASTYDWSTGESTSTISINSSGTYIVYLDSSSTCGSSDTIQLTLNTPPTVDLGPDSSFCSNINLPLDAQNNGATYLWNDGTTSQSKTISTAGIFFVDVTDVNNCTTRDSVKTTLLPQVIVDLGPAQTLCGTYNIISNAQNIGSTYLWNTGETTQSININARGQYIVVVSQSNGCTGTDTLSVSNTGLNTVSLGGDKTICENTSLTLDAQNHGSSYLWSTGATLQKETTSAPGEISVIVTSPSGCNSYDTLVVTIATSPTASLPADQTICENETVNVATGNATDSHVWSNGEKGNNTTINNAISLSVEITNANGCTFNDTVEITLESIDIELNGEYFFCEGTSITVTPNNVNNQLTYTWNNTFVGANFTPSQVGTSTVIGESANGCTGSKSTEIVKLNLPDLILSGDTIACLGETVDVQALSNGTVRWGDGTTNITKTIHFSGVENITASVNVNNTICSKTDSITVIFYDTPAFKSDLQLNYCFDQSVGTTISPTIEGTYYEWERPNYSRSKNLFIEQAGIYEVTAYNHSHCTTKQQVIVSDACPVLIYVPNAFTPNSDGINDVFIPKIKNAISYELTILNRWGEIIFTSSDPAVNWDGKLNGKMSQTEVYVWKITAKGYNESLRISDYIKTGTVTLVN